MKVGTRLAIGFLLVILCIWAIILLDRVTYTKIHQEVELLNEDIVPGTIIMAEMHRTTFEIAHQVMDYIAHTEVGTKEQLQSKIEYIKKLGIEHLQLERHLGKEHLKSSEKVIMLTNGMISQVENIIRLKDHGMKFDELLKKEAGTVHKALAVLSESISMHTGEQRKELDKTVESVHEAHVSGLRFHVLLAAVVTLFAVAVSLYITRSIVKPLHALEKGTGLIGQGNLGYRVGTNIRDEIGELSRAFDQMTLDLQRSTVSIVSLEKEITDRKRTEEELEREKREKEMILDSLVEHVVYQNLENKVLWANRAACESVQKTREELVGQYCYEIWAGRQSTCEDCPIVKAFNTGVPQSIEKTTPDGRTWYVRGYPVRDISGDIVGIVELTLGITELKLAEEALRESEERFRMIVKGARAGYFFVDRDGLWKDVNEAWLEMHGYSSREEVIGKHFSLTQVYDDMEMAQRNVENLLNGKPIESGEFSRRCKDGSVAYHTFSAIPVKRSAEIVGLEGFIIDDTERRQVEEALRESEEKFRTLFENSRDAIYITSREGQFIDINQAALDLFDYTREEMIGMNAKQTYVNPDDRRGFQQEIEEHGFIRHYEVKLRKKDGTEMNCMLTSSVRKSNDGSILGYQGIIHDVTEQKRLEVELQQAQKLETIGTLAGGIAHDFNNLLMAIQGNASLMLLDMDSTHEHYERLKSIEKQVESGARLTSQLLGYARKGRYEVKAVDLNQLVEELSETFRRARKQITIHRKLAGDLYAIEADSGQIEQVLLNLFVNAADAMPVGGELILISKNITHKDMKGKVCNPKPGKYVMLTVTDTGMGMDKETMGRVFDPFFTTKKIGSGTGLGLASAYGIIKGHNGYIDVESVKGYGSTFKIYLPASKKKVQKVVTTADETIKGTGTALLVDDEVDILEISRGLLEAMGYRVLIARDGKEAIEVYENNRDEIDIVVLDMVMPKMGGGEAYYHMRKINPNIKVLLSSGYSIDSEASEILEQGCDGFIQKPFTIKDLSQAIRKILRKR